ncbi:Uncharacterised protein [Mycobacteroides abscessus subsp. abscessus]|nr:Uncharacterised protein [Mycobacteroides abscessus subsp. abscessus]
MLIHLSHLKLVLEVGAGTQSLHDRVQAPFPDKVHQQTLPRLDPQIGQVGRGLADHLDALVNGEHARFVRVDEHGDNHLVELRRGSFEHIQVPKGHRIERAGAHRSRHTADLVAARMPIPLPICITPITISQMPTTRVRVTIELIG